MSAPVLSTKQKNKTLSAKKNKKAAKKKPVNTVRTILCSNTPSVNYRLSPEECLEFENKLSTIFHFEPPILPIWNKLKNVPREKRKEVRSQLSKCQEKHPSSSHLIFGINSVTRAIETKNVSSVIVSNDITPSLLTRHIYEACEIYKIPLRVIINLRTISKKCFGFPSIAIGFKKNIPSNDPVYEIGQFIKSFLPVQNSPEIIELDDISTEDCNTYKHESVAEQQEEEEKIEHLVRNNILKRCFVPGVKIDKKAEEEDVNFIKFDFVDDQVSDSGLCSKMKKKNKGKEAVFRNLKVIKIQGNKNRKKKKS